MTEALFLAVIFAICVACFAVVLFDILDRTEGKDD